MSIKHAFRHGCVGLLFVVAATLGTATVSRAATTPEAYIRSLSSEWISILTNPALDERGRYEAFRSVILGNTDLDGLANFALGRYAGPMRATNRYDEYVTLFREYIVRIYAAQLGQYSGERLMISRSAPSGPNEVIVFSAIQPGAAGGNPISVDWRLSQTDGSYRIKDVKIVGAWLSVTQRDQFTSVIANNNRQPTKLIDYLHQQLASTARPNGSAS